jgi:prolyl 4-hydroxylase
MSTFTPQLAAWLTEQMDKGCTPDVLRAEMLRVGYEAGFISTVVGAAFVQQNRAQNGASSGNAQAMNVYRDSAGAQGSQIMVGDHVVDVLFSMMSPRVILFGNVLTHAECDKLRAQATVRMKRAEVVNPETGAYQVDSARSSDGAAFSRAETDLVSTIEDRIAQLIHWPASHGEGLQVLHYRPGGEYQPHYDYFPPSAPGSAAQLAHGGQRIATMVIYLNDCPMGGSTVFPNLGFETMPKKGGAVYFAYTAQDGTLDERSLHAGAPVISGDKWIATKWLRQYEYA